MGDKKCMIKKNDSRTALRLPSELRQRIEHAIAEGKFESLSAVMRTALRHYLDRDDDNREFTHGEQRGKPSSGD